MRIVVFSIVPSPYQRDFFKALSKKVDLQVYYLEAESPDSPWPRKALEVYEVVLPGTYISFRGMRFFVSWKIPTVKGADALIFNGYMGTTLQWFLRYKSDSYCKSFFWGERMMFSSRGIKAKIQNWLIRPLKNCEAIVAIGSRAVEGYRLRFVTTPVFNIPYSCDLELFQNIPLKVRSAHVNLLFCGQMIHRKGLDVLLTSFDELSMKYDITLHLVGREAEVEKMLDTLSTTTRSKIVNHGFQPPDMLPEFFSLADVFVLPSRYDGWGVVVNQALGAGLPVICSDQVGAGIDLIDDGKNGFVFKSGDAHDLSSKLRLMMDDSELIPLMSQCSREKSFEITPEKRVVQWLDVFSNTP
jgi:poly(glycerol-phosphate) alpha-glucosyltransferase